MRQLWGCVLISALALSTFSEASPKPKALLQDTPPGPEASRSLGMRWPTALRSPSHYRRQLHPQDLPHLMADLSKKQGPWQEEEEAYGWMDFGRRSAEERDQLP
ncbi:gastrin [Phascolarctos cinereus]|uniref:Gastrin n=1 Tax=Phascolarctos cinereus TaxID=38626 RepID=A0A6P5JBD5_PHACI|nr:gastrin [Phascolarctos cinereus]XP_020828440.1 gastrin [Phascolarctos cinereus]